MKFKGYEVFKSDKPEKKYFAIVRGKKVYFGDTAYEHFFDKLGIWSSLNHNDPERRRLYLARTASQKKIPGTAAWFAREVLW